MTQDTHYSRSYSEGFSLTEVLVALLLTLIVMASVFGLLDRGQSVWNREPEVADVHQNARSGLVMINQDLQLAGYLTPPSTAILWLDGGGITPDELTVLYSDPDIPISEPIKCDTPGGGDKDKGDKNEGGGGGACKTIDQSSTLYIDP
ncbi:MAG: PilW family protein, partial [Acidobacteriota bacterium]